MEEGLHFITIYLDMSLQILSREEFTYVGIFLVLLLAGFGLPIPEEAILIFGGYLAFLEYTRFSSTVFIAFIGVLVGDTFLFFLGRRWGELILNHHRLSWLFTKKRLSKARRFFKRYGKRTIFLARFLSGIRAPIYLTAGSLKMRTRSFLMMDTFAALLSVPFFIFLGFFFGDDIDRVLNLIRKTEYIALTFILIGGLIIVLSLFRLIKKGGASEDI